MILTLTLGFASRVSSCTFQKQVMAEFDHAQHPRSSLTSPSPRAAEQYLGYCSKPRASYDLVDVVLLGDNLSYDRKLVRQVLGRLTGQQSAMEIILQQSQSRQKDKPNELVRNVQKCESRSLKRLRLRTAALQEISHDSGPVVAGRCGGRIQRKFMGGRRDESRLSGGKCLLLDQGIIPPQRIEIAIPKHCWSMAQR